MSSLYFLAYCFQVDSAWRDDCIKVDMELLASKSTQVWRTSRGWYYAEFEWRVFLLVERTLTDWGGDS